MLATYVIIAAVAYLLGSIPFGYILVRVFRGEDVRASGSGNIGATNVARKAPGLGLATLMLDAAKGFLAVALTRIVWAPGARQVVEVVEAGTDFRMYEYMPIALAALFAILGHMYPVWLKFKGGKGVATGVGAFVALAPKSVGVVLLIFLIVVAASRYVSLGSIVAAALFPVFAYLLYRGQMPGAAFGAMALSSALIIFKHRENIRRLLAGTEHKFELKRSRA